MRLIDADTLFNKLFVCNGKVCPNTDIDNFPITINVKDVKKAILEQPTAYDVDKVVGQLEEDKRCRGVLEGFIPKWKAIDIVRKGGVE